ncbi:MAG: molybdenum cofactor guanylyltransferase [Candidatus Acetothermia bacterium]|nr:molybdenum cofactor guanylyltransferase [Candidatus Acetothermia bacterium]MDH7505411.1 molybdenum cofactor guanylyltransferase [Candidatus Acetothermia bacterium]
MGGVTGIVLAGGRSRQLGRDKGLLCFEGEPLVVRAVRLLEGLCPEVLVITGERRRYTDLLDVPVVEDLVKGKGPLGGIYTGLMVSTYEYSLVVACDMPLLSPSVLSLLLERIPLSPQAEAILPRVRGYLEPFPGVYRRSCAAKIGGLLAKGSLRVHNLLELIPKEVVAEEELRAVDPGLRSFTNLNTPGELEIAGLG